MLRPVSSMLIFQLLLIFSHVRIFQPIRIGISITMRTARWKDLYFAKIKIKIKSANTSNITFLLMARKTSLFWLNEINYFYLHWFISRKGVWSNKGKESCGFEWSHLNLGRHNFDFHLCNTFVAVNLFVVAAVVVVAAAAVVVPVIVAVGKNVQV